MHFKNFDVDHFLREHWQKQPLLIRNPWAEWTNPLEPDELAGLACEDGVEARMVKLDRARWKLEDGPFPEEKFAQLGAKRWTLLVQAVDQLVPDVAALIEPFRFVPNWRIDDVMVSYATDGGGVGPHFDQYDVFLVQGLGRRRWQVGPVCDAATELLPHDDLRLLAHFQPTDEWLLGPGDILYVPPRFAHNGEAVGDDCMTYSIGFRAPSRSELLSHWCDHVLAELDDDDRYADPDLARQANPGEIASAALDRLHAMVSEALLDRDGFARWFGQYTSTPKYPDALGEPDEPLNASQLRKRLATGEPLVRNPASRFAFIRNGGGLTLFVDGENFACGPEIVPFAEALCAQERLSFGPAEPLNDATIALIATLYDMGSVGFEAED